MSEDLCAVTIYHNPACSTSRSTLALIRERGVEPRVVEYLKTPPTRDELRRLLADMHMPVRELLRRKEAVYDELRLDDPARTDEELVDAIVSHPILMNRPIVATLRGTHLCRPADAVLDLLDAPQAGAGPAQRGHP
jgi:arsenate reductase